MRLTVFCSPVLTLAITLVGTGCRPATLPEAPPPGVFYQFAPFAALVRGRFDGELRMDELLRHGDFGLGAPDGLDGELVVLDGRALQIRHDGSVHPYGPGRTTPAATVTFFRPQRVQSFADGHPVDQKAFEARLDELERDRNRFVAIRVKGTFALVRTRSAPPPPRPYPDLAGALSKQVEFEFHETKGTFVGFRVPSFANGFNFPGYHFHFVSEGERGGGHVLSYSVENVEVETATLSQVVLDLPGARDFGAADITISPSTDATQIERGGSQ